MVKQRNVKGNYAVTTIITSGPGLGTYNVAWNITSEKRKTGAFSGTVGGSEAIGLTGTIKGTKVRVISAGNGYSARAKGHVATNGSMSGSVTDSQGDAGTWTATPTA